MNKTTWLLRNLKVTMHYEPCSQRAAQENNAWSMTPRLGDQRQQTTLCTERNERNSEKEVITRKDVCLSVANGCTVLQVTTTNQNGSQPTCRRCALAHCKHADTLINCFQSLFQLFCESETLHIPRESNTSAQLPPLNSISLLGQERLIQKNRHDEDSATKTSIEASVGAENLSRDLTEKVNNRSKRDVPFGFPE